MRGTTANNPFPAPSPKEIVRGGVNHRLARIAGLQVIASAIRPIRPEDSTHFVRSIQLVMLKKTADLPAASQIDRAPSRATSDRQPNSSRLRFEQYRQKVKQQELPKGGIHSSGDARSAKDRVRSATQLVWHFLRLLIPYRFQTFWILASATAATLIGLLPPAGTKFIIDYGLSHKPLPEPWLRLFPSLADPRRLLLLTVLAVSIVSLLKILIQVWGRWYATKISKQIQLDVRRRVFEHAVRLPLHRVQEIRSGGVASILREDGGSVGELMFGMLFNPWRAIIQLIGSLAILAWVDWTLLLGALVLLPTVFRDPSRLDQQHSAAIPRDSQTARADRRGRHGIVRRNADRPRLQPAKARGGSVYHGEQPDGPPGAVCLVVDAGRRNGLGSSDSRRQRRTALLRRDAQCSPVT